EREVHCERARELVLHAFEQGHLTFHASGLLPQPVDMRRDPAETVTVTRANIECSCRIGCRRSRGSRPCEGDSRTVMPGIVACDSRSSDPYAIVAAQEYGDLGSDRDIELRAIVNQAGGGEGGAIAEVGDGCLVRERVEARAEFGASPPDVGAFGSEV